MFESLAPGYYDRYYARIFAGFAHAGPAAGTFRFEHEPPGATQPATSTAASLGCQFLPPGGGYVMNHLLILSHGFLRWFPECFPAYGGLVDQETERRRKAALVQIEELTRPSPDAPPRGKEWDSFIKRLVLEGD
jgi:hypothetical protein